MMHPKETTRLIGHEELELRLIERFQQGRLPHALLLTGPQGIGKATLAYRFARFLLSGGGEGGGDSLFGPVHSMSMEAEHSIFRRVAAGSHPDLLVIEPGQDERSKAKTQQITVEDARKVSEFLSLTPAESAWRVVVVDSADAMNLNAANALLKILEEPPKQAVLLVVCHRPGMLLPTIRSRCQQLAISRLGEAAFRSVLEISLAGEELLPEDIDALYCLSDGAPGIATEFYIRDGLTLYEKCLDALATEDFSRQEAFAASFSKAEGEGRWRLMECILQHLFAALICRAAGASQGTLPYPATAARIDALAAAHPLDYWLEVWNNANGLLADTVRIHLDRRQAVLNILQSVHLKAVA